MPFPKKWIPIFSFLTVAFIVWLFQPLIPERTVVVDPPRANPGAPQWKGKPEIIERPLSKPTPVPKSPEEALKDRQQHLRMAGINPFIPGTVKTPGESYTKMLVIPRMKDEDVGWIEENFGDDPLVQSAIYTVDDITAPLHPPKNKGHEVMIYLSYIIDFYYNLSDVNIFLHAHRHSWHSNELLDGDAVKTIQRLSAERVQRVGYMNLRCHWDPGCPSWMHPGTVEEDANKQEETLLARSWYEIFPLDPIPNVLAQPCCAQFAISRDRIQSIPLAKFVFYRDWLLRTTLSDYISGRVWEYLWQFVFTGKNVVCPKEHVCYCDGFGICFGGQKQYEAFYDQRKKKEGLENELKAWHQQYEAYRKWLAETALAPDNPEPPKLRPDLGKDRQLKEQIDQIQSWVDKRRKEAMLRGDVAINRAREAGRNWKHGDGF